MIRFVPGPVSHQPTTAVTAGSIPSTTVPFTELTMLTSQGEFRYRQYTSEVTSNVSGYVYSHTSRVFMYLYLCYTIFWLLGRGLLRVCTRHRCSLSATLAFGTGCTCICSRSVPVLCRAPALLPLPPLPPYHHQASISRPPFLHSSHSHVGQQGIYGC